MRIINKFIHLWGKSFYYYQSIAFFYLTTSALIVSTILYIFDRSPNTLSISLELGSSFILFMNLISSQTPDSDRLDESTSSIVENFKKEFHLHKSYQFDFIVLSSLVPWEVLTSYTDVPYFRLFTVLRVLLLSKYLTVVFNDPLSSLRIKFSIVTCLIATVIHGISAGWLLIEGFTDDWVTAYNKAFYWCMTTLTTIGYGDMTPSNNISRVYTTVIMVLGVGVYGVIFGNISRLLLNADRHKEAKKEKINDIAAFLTHYQIPQRLKKEVFSYYHNLFNKNFSDKDNRIISELPSALQDELKLYMRVRLIKGLHLFKDAKSGCLRLVADSLETIAYSPGQYIIKKGDTGEEMFIIGHGQVEVIVEDNVVATVTEGQFFGEIALIKNVTRTADVKSKTYCELYTLNKENYERIVEHYPELAAKFQKQYVKRSDDKKTKLKKAS